MKEILNILNAWLTGLFVWLFSRKMDENAKLKAELATHEITTEIKKQEEKYEESKEKLEKRILDFQSMLERHKNSKRK